MSDESDWQEAIEQLEPPKGVTPIDVFPIDQQIERIQKILAKESFGVTDFEEIEEAGKIIRRSAKGKQQQLNRK